MASQRPDAAAEAALRTLPADVVDGHEDHEREHGGRIEKVEKWGNRKLAYRVAKQREGDYVHMALHSTQGDLIKELERRLKVSDPVIKYMTVRLDEELKRQQKLVAKREHRARRHQASLGRGNDGQVARTAGLLGHPMISRVHEADERG